jgi:putative flippase GtrA
MFVLVDIGHLWYMVGQIIAIVAATACNFAGNKAWTFRATPTVRPKEVKTGALRAIVLGNVHGYDTGRAR